MKRKITLALLVATAVMSLSFAAAAADSETRIEPYLWSAGFSGTLGAPGTGPGLPGDIVDSTFGDLVGNLDIAGGGMLYAEWRGNRWSVFGDWTYARLTSQAASPIPILFAGVEGELKGHIVQGAVGYRIYGGETSRVDLFGGLRYYNLDLVLDLQAGLLGARSLSADDGWVDGVVGARWESVLGGNWVLGLQGDVGTGGSDFTWQGNGSIAYRFSWCSIAAGWRHLEVKYEKSGMTLDAALSGPYLGVLFRF
ncbi:MAG TPA: hypothetical protein DEH27_00440 [Deltaproteobacteria bacterium]|nr:hypothetical protein [Deltaproteobacteria bacterium]